MKKQGAISRIITVVLGFFLVSYIGFQAYRALYHPAKTVSAVYSEVDDSIPLDGYFIREERVMAKNYGSGVLEMNMYEGERVASGSAVAIVYADAASAAKNHEAMKVDEQITQMTQLYLQSGENYDVDAANDKIANCAVALASISQEGVSNNTSENVDALKLETMIREYMYRDKSELVTVIDSLKNEKKKLQAETSVKKRIYAPSAGYFSQNADGYESVLTKNAVMNMTTDEFLTATDQYAQPDREAIGKLITSNIWYYAAVIDKTDISRLKNKSKMILKFSDKSLPEVEGEIVRITEDAGDKALVVFECNTHISSFTKVRKTTAQAVVKTYSGLKVPREALRVDENGQNGVFCLIDSQVKFKPIEIIFEKDSYYVAKYDSNDTKSLLLYDEIIISAKNLENRKIIK